MTDNKNKEQAQNWDSSSFADQQGVFGYGGGIPDPSPAELAEIERLRNQGALPEITGGAKEEVFDSLSQGQTQEVENHQKIQLNEASYVEQDQGIENDLISQENATFEGSKSEKYLDENTLANDFLTPEDSVEELSWNENQEFKKNESLEDVYSDQENLGQDLTGNNNQKDANVTNSEENKINISENKKKNNSLMLFLILFILTIIFVGGGVFVVFLGDRFVFIQLLVSLFRNFWWLFIPITLWLVFRVLWGEYTGILFGVNQRFVLLEIRPSADVERSPKIMEQVFTGLHTFSGPNVLEEYCGWRPFQDTFTLEIVSTEGSVHFYVRCPAATRNNVESQIYAQYPACEISEVDDYTRKVPESLPNKDWDVWGASLKPIDHEALPIKTHPYFVEDVTKGMIDPLASLIEVMGSIGRGQHIWLQIIIAPLNEKDWLPKAQEYLNKLMGIKEKKGSGGPSVFGEIFGEIFKELASLPGNIVSGSSGGDVSGLGQTRQKQEPSKEKQEEFNINRLTPADQEKVKRVYEGMAKLAFDSAIRFVYLGKRENYNKAHGVAGVMGALKQFSDLNSNSLVPDSNTKTFANYVFTESRSSYRKRRIIKSYRGRTKNNPHFLLNTEELASLYHFPDISVQTSALNFKDAKKGEAPTNIPVGFEP